MSAFLKLKAHIQILIVAAVCGGLLGGAWYMYISPVQTEISSQTAKIAELDLQIAKSKQQQARFEQFKREVADLQVRLDELKRILPQDKETEQVLRDVQASARTAGLRIQQGISRPIIDHEIYTEWPLEMEVIGTYHNLASFLEKIRQLPRIVNVGKLRVENRPSSSESPYAASINVTYEATTFVYREEIAEAAPAAKTVKAGK